MAETKIAQLSIDLVFNKKSLKDSQNEVEKQTENWGSKLASKAGSVAKSVAKVGTVAITAAAAGISAIVKKSTDSFANYEQLVGGVETLFKDSAKTVEGYADAAFKTAGISANDYMNTVTSFSASLLQGLGGDTAKAADIANTAVIDMADNANKMGTSIESIQYAYQGFAKQNYTMLDNLKLGYGGSASEMARLINDSGVLGDTMEVTAQNVNEVSFDKMIEAIHVVQENLGITGTTAKEANETIQGSVASMSAAWQNMLTGLADPSQDFGKLVDNLIESVGVVITNLVPVVQNALTGVANLIASAAPKIAEVLPGIFENVIPKLLDAAGAIVPAIADAITQSLPAIASSIIKALPAVFKSILGNLVKGVVEVVGEVIPALAEELPPLVAELTPVLLDALNQFILILGTTISESMPFIISAITDLVMLIAQQIPTILTSLVDAIMSIAEALVQPQNLQMILHAALTLLMGLVKAVPDILVAFINALPQIITNIVQFLTDPANIGMIIAAAVELLFGLVAAVPQILGALLGAFGTLVGNLWNGITSMFGNFAANFGNFIGGIFKNALNGVLSFIEGFINSPINILNGFIGVINGAFGWLGVNLGNIPTVQLPRLAEGGFADGATAAIFGEAGAEVALPLENNTGNWAGLLASTLAEEMEEREESTPSLIVNFYDTTIRNDDDINKITQGISQVMRRSA